ncbi:Mitochondrial acidic protein mam33 [Gaertneriomyces sp. JEL0708]|nr:Mitochondrial acidic protein mam33 [Gaertneriomyces sp. JEL0708]
MFARSAARCVAAVRPISLMARFPAVAVARSTRNFSIARVARMSQGVVDKDLEFKLQEEIKYEKENTEPTTPEFLKQFENQGLWKIENKSGEKEVVLKRSFGNEKITVFFSTDALVEAQEFEDIPDENSGDRALPVNMSVIIEKKSGSADSGALDLSVTAQDSSFFIESVAYSPSSSLAVDQTSEGDWQRRGRYGGPVFNDLDESLQDLFHSFLEERGFDESLAAFIPQYVEYKEQQEYVNWLGNVAKFVKE